MKKIISKYDFTNDFNAIRPDNFSYAGLIALFNYLEEVEESMGGEIELDVIALCCEYTETTIEEYAESYMDADEDVTIEDAMTHAQDHTVVIPVDCETFIYAEY